MVDKTFLTSWFMGVRLNLGKSTYSEFTWTCIEKFELLEVCKVLLKPKNINGRASFKQWFNDTVNFS